MLALSQVRDGRGLAIARIGIGLAGLLCSMEAYVVLRTVAAGDVIAIPMAGLPPVGTSAPEVFGALAATGSVFVLVGLFTRPAALCLGVALAAAVVVEEQTYSNHLTLCAWSALWLLLGRSDARWSLRARIDGPSTVQLGDQILLMTQLSVVYAITGVLKINERFLSGETVNAGSWLDLPTLVASALAVGAVLTELALVIGLWLPRIRWWVAAAGVGLHVAIPIMMLQPGVWIFSLLTLSLYPLYLLGPPAVEPGRRSPGSNRAPSTP